jgi:hypothetical protein
MRRMRSFSKIAVSLAAYAVAALVPAGASAGWTLAYDQASAIVAPGDSVTIGATLTYTGAGEDASFPDDAFAERQMCMRVGWRSFESCTLEGGSSFVAGDLSEVRGATFAPQESRHVSLGALTADEDLEPGAYTSDFGLYLTATGFVFLVPDAASDDPFGGQSVEMRYDAPDFADAGDLTVIVGPALTALAFRVAVAEPASAASILAGLLVAALARRRQRGSCR